jgi:hypothetical protein
MLIIVILLLLFLYYLCYKFKSKNTYNINFKTLKIFNNFFNKNKSNIINIIALLGNNTKSKNKYIKVIAKLYHRKIIKCNLHKLHNTNDIKNLLFHKNTSITHNKHVICDINTRLYIFHNIYKSEFIEYVNEISNIIRLLNYLSNKTKFFLIFVINDNYINYVHDNCLYITLNKNYNHIKYFNNNKLKVYYYSQ